MGLAVRKLILSICFVTFSSLWFLSYSSAQPIFSSELSLDAMLLNGDLVVVGGIDAIEDHENYFEVTIIVDETFNEFHRDRLKVRFNQVRAWDGLHVVDRKVLQPLMEGSLPMLISIRNDPLTAYHFVNLADRALEMRRKDLTILRTSEDVLRAVRATIQNSPGVRRIDTFPIMIPLDSKSPSFGTYAYWGGNTSLKVPIDASLEKRMIEYLDSTVDWKRREGAYAIRYFKSNENIERVQAMLNDKQWRESTNKLGSKIRVYGLRYQAFEVLNYWGIKTEMPFYEEPVKLL